MSVEKQKDREDEPTKEKETDKEKDKVKSDSGSGTASVARSDPLAGILGTHPTCRYVKRKLLGQGSFGSAWRVEETATGRTLAAKVMDLTQMSVKDRGFVANEVKCLSRCSHPHIIRCEEAVEREGMLLIVMEYADGGDLYRQIKVRQQSMRYFREHEVVFILLQLCLALDHIHANKMMHRDIKTANILLTTTGLVKLGDFGFSRQYEDSLSNTVGSTFCGTPYYLSPELWHRQMYSKKSEMWSLGVVLYEVMALRRPFGGNNMDELIQNICAGARRPLPDFLSPDLVAVCDQLLSIEPAQRPSLHTLFQQPFIAQHLRTLQSSVERHNRIPEPTRGAIIRSIVEVLTREHTTASTEPAAKETASSLSNLVKRGAVQRHTAGAGWQDYELTITQEGLAMRLEGSAKTETAPRSALASVCQIDEPIAGERFVFAVRKHSGKAYWFKVADKASFEAWIVALQAVIEA